MDDCPHTSVSESGDKEDMEEEEANTERGSVSFPCHHCERRFTSRAGLERHLHVHNSSTSAPHPDQQAPPLSASNPSSSSDGDQSGAADGHHACKYCEKVFNTQTNRRRHERRIHEQQVCQRPQEERTELQRTELQRTELQRTELQRTERGDGEQFMLDVSSDISENLSFYIDGKIVSTSTVSSCEAAEVHSVSLDALILDASHISQVFSTDAAKETQVPARRRTATPPLLPQIQTELESEVVVSSSSSSLVSSLMENLLPQNAESVVAPRERTVFLSPKLKQLLEKQDGLKPTLALIADGQKPCSPVSLSVLPAGTERFKRRTASPPHHNPSAEEDGEDVSTGPEDSAPPVEEPAAKPVSTETWSPATGGHSCNQQPLDLSNAVRRQGGGASAEAVLDLSLQKKSHSESEPTVDLVPPALLTGSSGVSSLEGDAPLRVADFAILAGADLLSPVEPLLYGLTLPSSAPASLTSAAPCAIAFASSSSHSGLPAAPLITVLAPPHMPAPSNQPIQLLAPNLAPEPLLICTDNTLNFSECDLTTAFAATNPANPAPLDAPLNLPGHVFLSDQIALNPPIVEATPLADLPFPPTVTLNDSLINTVLIECTIALEAPGGVGPAAALHDPPAPDQVESAASPPAVEPSPLMSPERPAVGGSDPDPAPPAVSSEDGESSNAASDAQQQSFTKNFVCNVCDTLFHSMKELGDHAPDHAPDWPYKCEFCLLLFSKPAALLDHRSSLHGVGKTYVCSACAKEFVYLCNLKRHQEELHPAQHCSYTEEEKGKLRPQNYNSAAQLGADGPAGGQLKKEEGEEDAAAEELLTTIKIMASDGAKLKGPDVRLGINQHYPSFKPPPFPYHNRSPAASLASATSFSAHNIPQTFSTAIRCTKCGKSFDNMPELHKHILACANASDKRRYTPKRNPIPLRHFAKTQNGVLSSTNSTNGLNAANRPRHSQEALSKRKRRLVQRVMPQRNKAVKLSPAQPERFVCPHCGREFTMRRSRTKHMAVCPRKPKEAKKRKEGGVSVTKENDGRLHRGAEDKRASPRHKTRLQTAAKRPPSLPAPTLFSSKRSKIVIKESMQPKQESELPVARPFNPSMRQYGRAPHAAKGVPIKITIVKPTAPQRSELPVSHSGEDAEPSP